MDIRKLLIGGFVGLIFFTGFAQQTIPASEVVEGLKSLGNTTSVLYIAAHPDDENTRLISYLTKHEHADVSYLSLTRGDGGQNLIGTEIGDQLGVIRTQELLAARHIDGGKQYFSRAIDFGYSKTPEETFKFWDKEAVLSDVVWVIRKVRPDVIITRFSPEINPDRGTHGHHTASAILAMEAFEAAADPTRFPEQLAYVKPWQPKSLFWNTSYWFYGSVEKMAEQVAKAPEDYVKIDVNPYLPLIGKTGSDISSASRSQHKSQGFGNSPVIGPQWEYLQLLKGSITEQLFVSSYKSKSLNSKLDKLIAKAIKSFNIHEPSASISLLFDIRDQIAQLQEPVIRKQKLDAIHELIRQCAGIKTTAFCKEQLVYVGQQIESTLAFSSSIPVTVKAVKSTWNQGDIHHNINQTTQYYTQQLTWDIPDNGIHQPYWLTGNKTAGSYLVDNQELIGLAESPYPFVINLSLEINGQTMVLPVRLEHGSTDPVKGQIIQPLVVTPNVMVNLERSVLVFTSRQPKTIQVEVTSGKPDEKGYVELFIPDGWACEPAFIKTSFKAPGEKKVFQFKVTPPEGESTGNIRAIFKDDALVYSMGIYQFEYDHIPRIAVFPTAEAKVVKIDLKKVGSQVAYIMGAGDKVPEAIEEMGYNVTPLTVEQILVSDLKAFQAVVVGIRALNTIESIENINEKVTEYVNNGGTLVMQYNTAHQLKSPPLGPYSIKLSRDRVTEEDAEVLVLDESHKVMTTPNKITQKDFEDWVQERGLYFPETWDKEMKPMLSMHDANETDTQGSLLVGAYGKGYVVYTGLSFFRELPAGVPGAYRLLANILSL